MSTTPDLDTTIGIVNDMLSQMKNKKDRLAAVDRLAKLYALKYKFSGDGKGSKFSTPETPEETE